MEPVTPARQAAQGSWSAIHAPLLFLPLRPACCESACSRIFLLAAAFDLVRRLLALGEIDWHADRPLENPAALDAMLAVS